jgi:hypothetical protein
MLLRIKRAKLFLSSMIRPRFSGGSSRDRGFRDYKILQQYTD